MNNKKQPMQIKDINTTNIKAFIMGYIRSWAVKLYNKYFKWVEERKQYRQEEVEKKSPECIANGQCKHCGCTIPELFYADKGCSNTPPCYAAINSKEEWIDYKISNNLIV